MRDVMRVIACAVVCLWLFSGGCAGGAAPPESAASSSGGESITNVQEQGVDEGGIVKMHGEHLVVLRRGRLFSVDLSRGAMQQISAIDAYAPGRSPAEWYDELLVHDDTLVVIGFSYRDRATEIGLFDIDAQGRIAHRGSFQLRSNDYYSSRNYASRLIGDQLVLYVPHELGYAQSGGGFERSFPALRAIGGEWIEIDGPVHASLAPRDGRVVLHTVVMCGLQRDALGCRAQGMLGPAGRTFYVARDAVYVWISDGARHEAEGRPSDAMVYRLPLDGGATGAVRAWGAPTDQLSFKEADDGQLHVLVQATGGGDAMWSPEVRAGDLALASIPLAAFGAEGRVVDAGVYRALPRVDRGALTNRFVGDWVLFGGGDAWGYGDARGGTVYASSWRYGGPVYRLDVGHAIERIEAMGTAAVVIGRDQNDLAFSSIALAGGPQPIDRYTIPHASQGETRTHGFFYRDDGEGRGVLGLPVRGAGASGWSQLWESSASVQFLRVDAQRFSPLGGLASTSNARHQDDHCQASCADWYGNARPIFWRGRVFALLGYELVEGRVAADRILEQARLTLRP